MVIYPISQPVALLPCDILIVDDDPTLRSALTDFLKRCGYRVQSAKDGGAAIKLLGQHRVQLVITDLFMPEVDGFELILHLRKVAPSLKILAMSGDGLSDLDPFLAGVRQLGVLDTLIKPFSLEELAGVVRKAIGEAL